MSRRIQKMFSFKSPEQLDELAALAAQWGFFFQNQPNPSGLVQAIAGGDILLVKPPEWSLQQQEAVYQLLIDGREVGHSEAVEEAGLLALSQHNLAPSLRQNISEVVKLAKLPILDDLQSLLAARQPFKIAYNNSAGEDEILTCVYGHLELIEKHKYLVARVTDPMPNPEHPDLAYNRCLRLDRIVAVQPVKDLHWGELDYIEVVFWLYGGWTRKYEPKPADLEPGKVSWINSPLESGETIREVRRRVWSGFWFLREVMRYGDVQIISPESIKEAHIQKLLQPLKYYEKTGGFR